MAEEVLSERRGHRRRRRRRFVASQTGGLDLDLNNNDDDEAKIRSRFIDSHSSRISTGGEANGPEDVMRPEEGDCIAQVDVLSSNHVIGEIGYYLCPGKFCALKMESKGS